MHKRFLGAVALLISALVALSVQAVTPAASAETVASVPGVQITEILSGMRTAAAVREAPDGRIYVATKRGIVEMFDGPGDTTAVRVVDLNVETHSAGDRGMLGLELDPKFSTGRPYLYVLYAYNKDPFGTDEMPRWYSGTTETCPTPPGNDIDGCTATGRLERYTLGADGRALAGSRVLLIDGVDTDPHGGWCFQFPSHSIGTVKFGNDGALYVGAGDGASFNAADYGQFGGSLSGTPTPANSCNDEPGGRGTKLVPATSEGGALRSQAVRRTDPGDFVSWSGSILRINPDTGAAMPDNPLVGNGIEGDDRIIAYGMRNPFRFNFRPGTNELWVGDVGWARWEEINRFPVGPGQTQVPNFGWPCREGTAKQPSYDAADLALCEQLYTNPISDLHGVTSPEVSPYFVYSHNDQPLPAAGCGSTGGAAVVGGVFLTDPRWPAALRGAYVFSDYARGCIAYLPARSDGLPDATNPQLLVAGAYAVDLQIAPDGSLLWTDLAFDTISKMAPVTSGNQPPTASFTATPSQGPAPLTVSFDASATVDPEGGTVTYSWDLDGDGACDDATGMTTSRTYTTNGQTTVTLCATDPQGSTGRASRVVTVGAAAPTITSLTSNVRVEGFKAGDTLRFTGAATEPNGVSVPASRFSWVIEMRHCENPQDASCHTHIMDEISGTKSPAVSAPDHEYYTYVRARLTVTGSSGLTAEATSSAHPKITRVTLKTQPSGIAVANGLESGLSPVNAFYTWGGVAQLLVPQTAVVNGKSYRFNGWSDGVTTAQRTITVPKTDTSRTAKYVEVNGKPGASSWSFTPTSAPGVPVTFTATAQAFDDTGVASVRFRLIGPDGTARSSLLTMVSGTVTNGSWTGTLRLPSTAVLGTYQSALLVKDVGGTQVTLQGPTVKVGP